MSDQTPSAERRRAIRQMWQENGGWFDEVDDAVMRGPDFWEFWAALGAQSAERTRAEVEKMREAAGEAIKRRMDGAGFNRDAVLQAVYNEVLALPIEGTSQ